MTGGWDKALVQFAELHRDPFIIQSAKASITCDLWRDEEIKLSRRQQWTAALVHFGHHRAGFQPRGSDASGTRATISISILSSGENSALTPIPVMAGNASPRKATSGSNTSAAFSGAQSTI